jgi:DNA-binding NarL/FixJ family response regulator
VDRDGRGTGPEPVEITREQVRVLVAGRHPLVRGVVRVACDDVQRTVVVGEAESAEGVAPAVADLEPDLLVLDLDLGGDEGLATLRGLRDGGFDGTVLVLADRSDGGAVLEALRLGAAGYLQKSAGLRALADALRRIVGGERAVPPGFELAPTELHRRAPQATAGRDMRVELTARERDVLTLLADGLTMRQIARRLGISPRTVETHVAKLYRKLGARARLDAVARAARLGLLDLR